MTNRPCIKIAPGIYTHLSPETLADLRAAIKRAYPTNTNASRRRTYVTLACQPEAARRFMARVDELLGEEKA